MRRDLVLLLSLTCLAGACSPTYSPNTYASSAVQQANKVEQGVVVGVRQVGVSAAGTVGTATGAAAGGIAGSATPGGSVGEAFGALGGAVVGGLVGSGVEHMAGDTMAFEYIVRKANGDLLSVTQRDKEPLAVGAKVLLITGGQARIVPDYTVAVKPEQKEEPVMTAPPPGVVFDSPLPDLTPKPDPTPKPDQEGQAPTPLNPPPAAPATP